MQNIRKTTFAILCLLSAVSMTACGGGGGGGGGTTAGAAVSKGVVTALGSVVVNGINFSTPAGTTVKIDDNPSTADQLKVGMVVKVKGSSDDSTKTGVAAEVEAMDALEGTIEPGSVDAVTKTIKVMGQTVRIEDNVTRLNDDNNQKVFGDAGFAAGQRVEVHGFVDDQGGFRATRVARKAADVGDFEIKGFVTSTANPFSLSLTPGGAAVLTVTGALPAGAGVGSFVQVKTTGAPGIGGVVTAIAGGIKIEDIKLGAEGEKVEIEGVVASGNVNSFVINGQQVVTTDATLFEGGLKADFAAGIKVEAEGPLNANGAIAATKISFRSNIRIEGNITFTPGSSSLTVLGKTVVINPAPLTRIDNGPLANGQHVEVRAFLGSDGTTLVATRIVVRNPDTRAFLQGPVSNVTATSMSILGATITTNASTEFRISFDSSEAAVSSATFFAALKNNVTVVKVRWRSFSSTSAAVDQAEIEVGKSLSSSNDSSSKGVVTAKGSVFVNGVRFHTGGAAVMIDGVPATEDKLQVGMVVKVRGTIDDTTQTGTATLVEASNVLAGKITSVNATNKTITVLGQTVQIEDNVTNLLDDTAKVFVDAAFAENERVEVHGLLDDNGGLRATRVVKKPEGEFQVKGFVVSTGSPFGLSLTSGGTATFNVTGTLPAGAKIGSVVEVKATAPPGSNGAITATLVKLEDDLGVKDEKARVEGIVTSGTVASFVINGQKIVTGAATLFEGGLKTEFAVGLKVEAQGSLNADGAIVADKVSFRSNIRIEGVATVTPTGLTLLGLPVVINESTRSKDIFVNGDQVEVRAFIDRKNNLVATRVVKRSNVDGKAFLQGPVTAFNATAGTMTILGVPIQAASAQFRISNDVADVPVPNPADFFAKLTANVTVVKVRWDAFTATTAAVNQAEIQLGK